MTGKITSLVKERGFGFITPEGETSEIFFHSTALNGITFEDLNINDIVTFEKKEGPKGPAAENVSRS